MQQGEIMAHLAGLIAELRQQVVLFSHELDAQQAENRYLRELVGRLTGEPTPQINECHPHQGKFSREALFPGENHMKYDQEMYFERNGGGPDENGIVAAQPQGQETG